MLNVLVYGQGSTSAPTLVEFERSRIFEYTQEEIRSQLVGLSLDARESIISWPTIFMGEGTGDEILRLARIDKIRVRGNIVSLYISDVADEEITAQNNSIWSIRDRLGILDFEFSRNHFAVKDVDFDFLADQLDSAFEGANVRASYQPKLLPMPERRAILEAKNNIQQFTHSEIDDFLLMSGSLINEAGREVGSKAERANVVVRYIFENPGAVTAENRLFARGFVDWVMSRVESEPPIIHAEPAAPLPTPVPRTATAPSVDEHASGMNSDSFRVFVVHGHAEDAKIAIAEFLERGGLEPVILHEQPNKGRHILQKFTDEASDCDVAVVLLTADDIGGTDALTLNGRARQNVIFEMGYFYAKLGAEKTIAVYDVGVELPSDYAGVLYIERNDNDRWKEELARELRAAGLPFRSEDA